MKTVRVKDMDDIGLIRRRFELITVARYRDKSKMKQAMKVQDELRKKSKHWDSTKEIRKWRNRRYGSSSS